MEIKDIKSLELDRTKAFQHCIRFKDYAGMTMEVLMVNDSEEWAQFEKVYRAWVNHPDYNGE